MRSIHPFLLLSFTFSFLLTTLIHSPSVLYTHSFHPFTHPLGWMDEWMGGCMGERMDGQRRRLVINIGGQKFGSQMLGGKNLGHKYWGAKFLGKYIFRQH